MAKETLKKESSESILIIKIKNSNYEILDKKISVDEIEKSILHNGTLSNIKKLLF